jgi:hypothetical protein
MNISIRWKWCEGKNHAEGSEEKFPGSVRRERKIETKFDFMIREEKWKRGERR